MYGKLGGVIFENNGLLKNNQNPLPLKRDPQLGQLTLCVVCW